MRLIYSLKKHENKNSFQGLTLFKNYLFPKACCVTTLMRFIFLIINLIIFFNVSGARPRKIKCIVGSFHLHPRIKSMT